MKKKFKIAVVIVLLFFSGTYFSLWVYSAKWFSQEIDRIYETAAKDGFVFLGAKPQLSNFPFIPEVRYTNGMEFGNLKILFPDLIIRGYPLPFLPLHLSFPKGVSMGGMVDPKIWTLSSLNIDLTVPYALPQSFYEEDLKDWKQRGGKIEIKKYVAQKDQLTAVGQGDFSVDENLQPVFNFLSVIDGYDAFINTEKERGLIDPFGAAIGMTILNGLSKTDEVTGQKTVTLNITAKNQMLWVGPIQALPLPLIVWDKRNSPVLRQ